MQPQISVIVPVYKAEKYLYGCIDSILAQTFTDFELILVNDGSPDNCGAICDEYAKKDKRVKVIHKENGGVTAARADGVELSKGEYITFVDADDTIPYDALYTLHSYTSENIDIVKGCINWIGYKQMYKYEQQLLNYNEYRSEAIKKTYIYTGPVASLIRRNLFNEETFNLPRDIIFAEDMIMNIRLAFATEKNTKIISENVYNYLQHPNSCVHTFILTIEYIDAWYKHVVVSVPKEQRNIYLNDFIKLRLTFILDICNAYIKNNRWKMFDFHKVLMQDVKKSKYTLKKIDKIILSCSNPISCGLFLLIRKIYIELKTILKRQGN